MENLQRILLRRNRLARHLATTFRRLACLLIIGSGDLLFHEIVVQFLEQEISCASLVRIFGSQVGVHEVFFSHSEVGEDVSDLFNVLFAREPLVHIITLKLRHYQLTGFAGRIQL